MRRLALGMLACNLWLASSAADAAPSVTAIDASVKVRAAARFDAPVIGILHAGQSPALLQSEARPGAGCLAGWWSLAPRGFVCGDAMTRDANHPRAVAARAVLPRADADYPFDYGRALGSPRYLRMPTRDEQTRREGALPPATTDDEGDAPEALRRHFARRDESTLIDPVLAHRDMKLSWARSFSAAGRKWLVTPELLLIPRDRVDGAPPVTSRALDLHAATLPLGWVLSDTPPLDARGVATDAAPWPAHALVALRHDPRIWRGDRSLLITKDGERAADADVAVFTQHQRPHGVGVDQKWIAVSINEGTLVAYRGDQPVMAALISPGMHGANPDGAYRTPPGRHRISSKWLTHDMTGPLGTGAWRSRDVPWVAYYDDSFAIHGAWWHDSFGRPRSHGCVNLTPSDARRLFAWMDPQLPSGWYAVRAQGDEGTLVVISP